MIRGRRGTWVREPSPYPVRCMEFDQLRTFLAVLEHRSFVRAGEALGIGQSTVSFHVKALEQRVGVVLLERGRGSIAPKRSTPRQSSTASSMR